MFAKQPSSSFQDWKCWVCVSITFRWVCSSIFVVEFKEDFRITIPAIVEHLKDSDRHVRNVAIELLSRMAAQGMY